MNMNFVSFEQEILTYEQLNNEHIVLCSLRH